MFSGAVKIDELNDYIAPSQECIVPIVTSANGNVSGRDQGTEKNSFFPESTLRPDLIKVRPKRTAKNVLSSTTSSNVLSEVSIQGHAGNEALETKSDALDKTSPDLTSKSAFHPSANGISELQKKEDLDVAQVSLYDCLACSGCVTTSETVLLQEQSVSSFLVHVAKASFSVVSISIESLRYISAYYKCANLRQCFQRLSYFFKQQLGISAVIDLSPFTSFVLAETACEFLHRYRLKKSDGQLNSDASTSKLYNSLPHTQPQVAVNFPSESNAFCSPSKYLPLLTSHCPGWICFCEKTQSSDIISRISSLKSAQQIAGFFSKTLMVDAYNCRKFYYSYKSSWNLWSGCVRHAAFSQICCFSWLDIKKPYLSGEDVFHTTVVPCYDKKLEILRQESFITPSTNTSTATPMREVDNALATVEVIQLLHQFGIKDQTDFHTLLNPEPPELLDDILLRTGRWCPWEHVLPPALSRYTPSDGRRSTQTPEASPLDPNSFVTDISLRNASTHGTASCACCHNYVPVRCSHEAGGFLDYTFRVAASTLFGVVVPEDHQLKARVVTNKDFKELCLKVKGSIKLRFMYAYGFRNIQNILRKLSPNTLPDDQQLDFVEIMACPRGCNYGAGQHGVSSPAKHSSREASGSGSETENISLSPSDPTDVLLPPHCNPFVKLLYQYLHLVMVDPDPNQCIVSHIQHSETPIFPPCKAQFRSLRDEQEEKQKAQGAIPLSALRW